MPPLKAGFDGATTFVRNGNEVVVGDRSWCVRGVL